MLDPTSRQDDLPVVTRWRILATVSAIVFMGLLAVAAVPQRICPAWLWPSVTAARQLLSTVKVRAGHNMFRGIIADHHIHDTECWTVWGTDERGNASVVYQTEPNCELPRFRARDDVVEVALRHLTERATLDLRHHKKAKRRAAQRRLQESPTIERLGRYFCLGNLTDSAALARVQIELSQTTRSVQSGKVYSFHDTVLDYDCRRNRRNLGPWAAPRGPVAERRRKASP